MSQTIVTESRAVARHVRVTPQKARRVVDLIRGKNAAEAIATLRFAPQAASEPIRKVLEYQLLATLASLGLRFKLEQASPVRAAARTKDGVWHVGGTRVDSSGGGCTVSGATRKDGSWTQTLGQARGKLFASSPVGGENASRLRVMVMHPMDTGLVGGIPAFYVNRLAVRDEQGRELLRLATFEPVSENPVFSFDFPGRVAGGLRLTGTDNNGNRIDGRIE